MALAVRGCSVTAIELLEHLRRLEVRAWVEGDRLRLSAPKGAVTSELQAEILQRKAELIALLSTAPQRGVGDETIPRRTRSGGTPLSFAQERLWFLEQLQPGQVAYSLAGAVRLRGVLDRKALDRTLATLVARHEALRTTFRLAGDMPVQVVSEAGPVQLAVVDLCDMSPAERERAAVSQALVEARRPFELEVGPLFRPTLYRLAPDDHVLLFCMHHMISDGWSVGVMVREIGQCYEAYLRGKEPLLPDLPIQYPDYAAWQREYLEGNALAQDLDYWKRALADLQTLELPSDRPRPAEATMKGARCRFTLSRTLADRLREVGRSEGATLFMTLLAAFAVLIGRYTGQDDVAVGSPIAGRDRTELEGLIGFFVNTLVLRTNLSGDPSFRGVLKRVKETCLGAYAHQNVPFEKLVEAVRPERDLSRNPLFQVMLALQNVPVQPLELTGLRLEPVDLDRGASQFDLTLFLREVEQGLDGVWEYSTDLFDRSTIERMTGHVQTLLEGVGADPDQRIGTLPMLTSGEQARIREWNDTAIEEPGRCVHELISLQAAQAGARVAVECDGATLTYAELETRAERLAGHLRSVGVGPNVPVGILLERSAEMVVAVLGVLKAGGAYVPLDPAYPADRLTYMVEDSGAPVLVTQRGAAEALRLGAVRFVYVDQPAAERDTVARPSATQEDLAYVIYTSGSTGKPKGVPVTHRSLANLLASMMREPGLTPGDTLLSVTTLSFDIAALELYLPLLVGARLFLATREEAADGHRLCGLLESGKVTVMQATPATWRLLLEAGWKRTPGLRVLSGGEALPRDLADQLLQRSSEVWNLYGPTETTIWSSAWKVEPGEGVVSIGRPIANTTLHVLDRYKNLLPVGVPGELYIGGVGLSPGYWNRPDLTAERFVADPFSGVVGARLYRTGDVARWLPDGRIQCLGRIDHQVKLRGFRVELGEIEAVLGAHPGIRHSVAHVHDAGNGDRRLVAYVVQHADAAHTVTELRRHVREHLPEYMVPSLIVELERIPLTPNGKVDRRALPDPFGRADADGESFAEPRTPIERAIAAIWKEMLKVDRVGVRDNFFDLGGHSLLSMQVIARIERQLGRRLHPRAMILDTLEQIAAACESPV